MPFLKFQSHLRLIHPIHDCLGIRHGAIISLGFNRICASSTLSTLNSVIDHQDVLIMFQSHLRLIHPIHLEFGMSKHLVIISVSIASAPHPPYPHRLTMCLCLPHTMFQSHLRLIHPIHGIRNCRPMRPMLRFNRICASSTLSTWPMIPSPVPKGVSIASAPHPPYPLSKIIPSKVCEHVSIASAPNPPYPPLSISASTSVTVLFQSHLRLIHPIHNCAKDFIW